MHSSFRRNLITGINYLLEGDAKSAWHRVKNADEIVLAKARRESDGTYSA